MESQVLLEPLSVKFEENYMFRNYRSITSIPDIALTEFVANAWDAGAYNVYISIPNEDSEKIIVEDDGIGMSDAEFKQRWMTLNYDRQARQGRLVEFPPSAPKYKRVAYGRNGIGRHGMICFNNSYDIETWKNGYCNFYTVSLSSGASPFQISYHKVYPKEGNGTKISAYIHRHKPDPNDMTDIISARFLYDPSFTVTINGNKIDLLNSQNIHSKTEIVIGDINLKMTIIDSTKTAIKSQQHGIAFWISGRLVGQPSWNIGKFQFLDGRCKAAKRFTIVVETNELMDEILPDWTGFIDSQNFKWFLSEFKPHIDSFINDVMSDQIIDLQQDVIKDTQDQLETLTPYEQRDVSKFIETVTTNNPIISQDFLKNAVEAVIIMEKAKKGDRLLSQISQLSADDIDKLSDLLATWNVDDILTVLNEIDKRITVVEAIGRIYEDKNTDELHTLHPLILNARWLFGSEFDSPMFVSNKTLATVVQTLFSEDEYDINEITNKKKRPDIVMLKNYSVKAVCTDRADDNAGGMMKPDQILIIELKRGGFEIDMKEVSQAEYYVRQIKKSGQLHNSATIHAFVVGTSIGDVDHHKSSESGVVDVVTYGQLVETAKYKLFRLQEQLTEHYDSLDDKSIVEKALKQPKQMKFD